MIFYCLTNLYSTEKINTSYDTEKLNFEHFWALCSFDCVWKYSDLILISKCLSEKSFFLNSCFKNKMDLPARDVCLLLKKLKLVVFDLDAIY
jgi:hypothetical protein